jgi:hypothetical protein
MLAEIVFDTDSLKINCVEGPDRTASYRAEDFIPDIVAFIRDHVCAPWYDRLLFGAKKEEIAMPSELVIDTSGKIVFICRSTRGDN